MDMDIQPSELKTIEAAARALLAAIESLSKPIVVEPKIGCCPTNVLLKLGVVKRITTAEGKYRASFAVNTLPVERERTMQEWAELVLAKAEKQITAEELLIRMLDAGYATEAKPQHSLNAVRRILDRKTKASQC